MTTPCTSCGSKNYQSELFATRDRKRPHDQTDYVVHWCRSCELGHIGCDSNAGFFDVPYYTHGNFDTASNGRNLLNRIAYRLDSGRDITPADFSGSKTLCDIGCGDGRYLKMFSEAGFDVVGVEPDPIARQRASEFGQVFDGTAEDVPFIDSKFDIVLLSHVLDACIDPPAALKNAASLLNKNGTLIAEVPNCASLGFRVHQSNWPWVDIPRHLTFFTEKSLQAMLERAGFSISEKIYVGYARQFKLGAGASWLARTALLPARLKYDTIRIRAT
jgi:SAM-dependent methyltransferase